MTMQELIDTTVEAQFETKREWTEFQRKAYHFFDQLSPEEQEVIIKDNVFEMISMIISAYEYE